MVEHCLKAVDSTEWQLEVHFGPNTDSTEMQKWLGPGRYVPQVAGDLGAKLKGAFASGFRRGFNKVVVIGSDCPDLDRAILSPAFEALDQFPLVLGPSEDGGYYLVGLNREEPALFEGISWSTEAVLEQTLQIAQNRSIPYYLTPILRDIDEPQDLERYSAHFGEL